MSKPPEQPPSSPPNQAEQPPAPAGTEQQNAATATTARPDLWSDYGQPVIPPAPPPLWSDYGTAKPPPTLDQILSGLYGSTADLLRQILSAEQKLQLAFPEKLAPRLPAVSGNNAVLKVAFALYDADGEIFDHKLDIPLTGFRSESMRPLALSTVQAALATLVMPQLVGAVTDYQETVRRPSEYSERPLLHQPTSGEASERQQPNDIN